MMGKAKEGFLPIAYKNLPEVCPLCHKKEHLPRACPHLTAPANDPPPKASPASSASDSSAPALRHVPTNPCEGEFHSVHKGTSHWARAPSITAIAAALEAAAELAPAPAPVTGLVSTPAAGVVLDPAAGLFAHHSPDKDFDLAEEDSLKAIFAGPELSDQGPKEDESPAQMDTSCTKWTKSALKNQG
jgi:hypothetical protein